MNKCLNLVLIGVIFVFLFVSRCFAEDLTITTYYPSPYGS